MSIEANQKVTAGHLKRNAYLYVRQSTMRQVFENTESTERQYALRQRAIALGWPSDRVIVIDSDLGQSGASAVDRAGFQKLVAEVGMGRGGIVLGLEVSRLARNSADWHRLLEICALTDTLILDEDGLYDPAHFNDRLLLGLKGTMSEAELHMLRARLRGGILNKARRGELRCGLPAGLIYDARGTRGPRSRPAGPGNGAPAFSDLRPHRHAQRHDQVLPAAGIAFSEAARGGPSARATGLGALVAGPGLHRSCTIPCMPAPTPSGAGASASSPTADIGTNICPRISGRC